MFNFLKDFGFPAYVVGIITLIVLAYKKAKEIQEFKLNASKEQLDSITDLLTNEEKMKNNFLVEQVFQYKFKTYIPAKIILRLLKTNNPTSSIKDYIYGKKHVQFEFEDNDISYSEKMNNMSYRKKWKFINLSGYVIFSFLGLFLLLHLPKITNYLEYYWIVALTPFIFYCLWLAYEFMMSALKISAAERLMKTISASNSENSA